MLNPKVAKAVKSDVVLTKTEAVASEVVADTPELVITETFSQFLSKLQSLASQAAALKTEFRVLEKKATRELKDCSEN